MVYLISISTSFNFTTQNSGWPSSVMLVVIVAVVVAMVKVVVMAMKTWSQRYAGNSGGDGDGVRC